MGRSARFFPRASRASGWSSRSEQLMDFVLSLVSDAQRVLHDHVESLCRGALGALERAAGETDRVDAPIVACLADNGLLDWTVPGAYATGRSVPSTPTD